MKDLSNHPLFQPEYDLALKRKLLKENNPSYKLQKLVNQEDKLFWHIPTIMNIEHEPDDFPTEAEPKEEVDGHDLLDYTVC